MKIITILCMVLFSFSCWGSSKDTLSFSINLLNNKFVTFEAEHSKCVKLSRETKLSNESIDFLKTLPIGVGEGLGYLSLKAIRTCVGESYGELLRVLLSVESANQKTNNIVLKEKINSFKVLMFPVAEFNSEKKYFQLEDRTKKKFNSIKELTQPFNMVDAFERAWLEQ